MLNVFMCGDKMPTRCNRWFLYCIFWHFISTY